MTPVTLIDARRAIEALRAGVPSRHAVQALGCDQAEIETRFSRLLEAVRQRPEVQEPGLLVQGRFGVGKSHLLAYLEQLALAQGFVCSKVVISKETPLYDPVKVIRAALRAVVAPGRRGSGLREIAAALQTDGQGYADLEAWAHEPGTGLNSRFPASLALFRRSGLASEGGDRATAFWLGEPLGAGELRRHLRAAGERTPYRLESAQLRELALQRLRFTPRLARAAGFAGWILLVDEVELVGSYSLLQRGRAYAELARWLGRVRGDPCPGLGTVLALMANYEAEVLEGKGDLEVVPERLRLRGQADLARRAEQGMRAIRRERLSLRPSSQETLHDVHDQVRRIHAQAYGWDPPAAPPAARPASTSLREHIRSWINGWDLERLYPGYCPQTVVRPEEVARLYVEDPAEEAG